MNNNKMKKEMQPVRITSHLLFRIIYRHREIKFTNMDEFLAFRSLLSLVFFYIFRLVEKVYDHI